jgi:hypothetical protein
VYVVPAGTVPFVPLTGFAKNGIPLQALAVILFITGVLLMVATTAVLVFELHPVDVFRATA